MGLCPERPLDPPEGAVCESSDDLLGPECSGSSGSGASHLVDTRALRHVETGRTI